MTADPPDDSPFESDVINKTSRGASQRILPRPEWALAYILNDWRRSRAVRKAYDTCSDFDADPLRPMSDDERAAVTEARRKLAAYVAALDEVLEDTRWRNPSRKEPL